MKKQKQEQVISINEFDETASLHQLIPSGAGHGLKHIKLIVDSILNNPKEESSKPLSLLITGKQGVRTHAFCFIRALGLEHINELPAPLIQSTYSSISDFFNPLLTCDSYIISSVEILHSSILTILYQIMTKGKYSLNNHYSKTQEITAIYHPLIMTAQSKTKMPNYFTEKIDHIVELDDYTDQQLELVVLQRLIYCKIDYDDEKILKIIVKYGCSNLNQIIRLLKCSITVMLADSRRVLTVDDVKKAKRMSWEDILPPPLINDDGIPF